MKTEQEESIAGGVLTPPRSFGKIIKHLGPGIIIAGSIVGSGELIATTLVGAQAGFTLLWLILLGCFIKIFVQVEFGRHTVIWSRTPLEALNNIPGPRTRRTNWLLWYWAIMTCTIITQQGGILGGVGEAMTMIKPLTEEGRIYNHEAGENIRNKVNFALQGRMSGKSGTIESKKQVTVPAPELKSPPDVRYWVIIIAVVTAVILYYGKFAIIQWISTILVFMFTVTSIINITMLQSYEKWAINWGEIFEGLSFTAPGGSLTIALATFGLIGMSASELMTYPYWCLEKGYAKFTGVKDDSKAWLERARGWIRIMKIDSLACMVVYTFSTVAFYLMGAAVLGRVKLMPEKSDLILTLSEMYVPVFGSWAQTVFVTGAIAVLYSTFFLVAAGNSRMVVDGLGLFGIFPKDERSKTRLIRLVSSIWPLIALALYLWFQAPLPMVLLSGIAQALMLPMLGFAALIYRYRYMVDELKPGKLWDVFLCLSSAGMFVVGFWVIYNELFK